MSINKSLVFKVLKTLLKFALISLDAILAIGTSEPKKPRYVALKAEELHDDWAISDLEYAKNIHGDDRRKFSH